MSTKTDLMLKVEKAHHRPLEQLLPEMYAEMGLSAMSTELRIAKGTAWAWMLRFGLNARKTTLPPANRTKNIKGIRWISFDRATIGMVLNMFRKGFNCEVDGDQKIIVITPQESTS